MFHMHRNEAANQRRRVASPLVAEVRAAMARRGVTQAWLAEATGISLPTLSRRLTAATPFTIDEVIAVGRALGVDPATFVRAAASESEAA